MHILLLSDNFPPETNAPATREFEHARAWVRDGHRVTVITCAPNFPAGELHPGYANRWYQRERLDGVDVVRVKTFIAPNRGFGARVLDYASFMVSGSAAGLVQDEPDVVVATSPQFFCALGGWCVAALRRKPFVFELRDLWPASIAAVGAMRPSVAVRALERLELFLYRRATRVVALTESFRDDLIGRGIAADKIDVVRNGVDLARFAPRPRDAELERRLELRGKFVVGYLGTHGMAHALHRVLEAAQILQRRRDVHFLFVGDGAARAELVRLARERGLENVTLVESARRHDMPALWSLCDVGLVHLRDAPLFAGVIPSKLFESFAMGVPVLYCGPDGEAARIVRGAAAGLTLPAERPDELARAVELLADDRDRRAGLAAGARKVAPSFDRESSAQAMLASLKLACGRTPAAATTHDARAAA